MEFPMYIMPIQILTAIATTLVVLGGVWRIMQGFAPKDDMIRTNQELKDDIRELRTNIQGMHSRIDSILQSLTTNKQNLV